MCGVCVYLCGLGAVDGSPYTLPYVCNSQHTQHITLSLSHTHTHTNTHLIHAYNTHTYTHTQVVARVEAFIAGWGLEEAVKRAEAYQAAGADAILMHSKKNDHSDIKAFAEV
jgi:hypothetical protein